jgi:hypothetical protein
MPDYGLTVLASCMIRVLAPEVQRRVPDSGLQAFRA